MNSHLAKETVKALRALTRFVEKMADVLSPSSSTCSSSNLKNPLIVISGCTGTGKSDLGVAIAAAFNGEVVNADSMQIYKGFDISSNKMTTEEMNGIPHHLMGFLEPTNSSYNVQDFREQAIDVLNKIWAGNKLPVIVGGTAYYIESVIFDNNLIASDRNKGDEIRNQLQKDFPSIDALYNELKRVDPETASELHRNNKHRVLRALEIFYSTGKTRSEHQKLQRLEAPEGSSHFSSRLRFKNTLLINLDMPKEVLIERLNQRVDKMIERGLLKEVMEFYDLWSGKVDKFGIMQIIGLKEFIPYLRLKSEDRRESEEGGEKLAQCKETLKTRHRQYAQRQRLWFYNRILNRGQYREIPKSLALDASKNFHEQLVPFALEQVKHFLAGEDLKLSSDNELLFKIPALGDFFKQDDYLETCKKLFVCQLCNMEIQGKIHWKQHLEGRKHRTNVGREIKNKKEEREIGVKSG